jgi:hypothetical protein
MGLQKIIASKTKVTTVLAKDPSKIEVPVMGESLARVKTYGHSGPLVLNIETSLKDGGKEPDLLTMVHRTKDVGDHCFTWMTSKKKITLAPKKVFDPNQLTALEARKDIDYKKWQPEFIYMLFSSNSGCEFNLTANF